MIATNLCLWKSNWLPALLIDAVTSCLLRLMCFTVHVLPEAVDRWFMISLLSIRCSYTWGMCKQIFVLWHDINVKNVVVANDDNTVSCLAGYHRLTVMVVFFIAPTGQLAPQTISRQCLISAMTCYIVMCIYTGVIWLLVCFLFRYSATNARRSQTSFFSFADMSLILMQQCFCCSSYCGS